MSNRIQRVNQVLKEEIGNILLREIDLSDVLITITRVDASPNLQEAKVYISVMPDNQIDRVFKIFKKEIYGIQQKLNKRLKMRPVPKIKFEKDKKTREVARIEGILEKINNKS